MKYTMDGGRVLGELIESSDAIKKSFVQAVFVAASQTPLFEGEQMTCRIPVPGKKAMHSELVLVQFRVESNDLLQEIVAAYQHKQISFRGAGWKEGKSPRSGRVGYFREQPVLIFAICLNHIRSSDWGWL